MRIGLAVCASLLAAGSLAGCDVSGQWKALKDDDVALCRKIAKTQALSPKSVRFTKTYTRLVEDDTMKMVAARFEAKNAFGVTLPGTIACWWHAPRKSAEPLPARITLNGRILTGKEIDTAYFYATTR